MGSTNPPTKKNRDAQAKAPATPIVSTEALHLVHHNVTRHRNEALLCFIGSGLHLTASLVNGNYPFYNEASALAAIAAPISGTVLAYFQYQVKRIGRILNFREGADTPVKKLEAVKENMAPVEEHQTNVIPLKTPNIAIEGAS